MFEFKRLEKRGFNVVKIKDLAPCIDVSNLKFIGKGKSAAVFQLSNDKCLKLFYNRQGYRNLRENEIDKMNTFTIFNLDCIMFPQKLVFIKDGIKGYIMDYVKGRSSYKCNDFDFSFFLSKYTEFMETILQYLKTYQIVMDDVHPGNILWDDYNLKFKAIDVDYWDCFLFSKGETNYRNIKELTTAFAKMMIRDEFSINYNSATNIDENTDFIDFYETMRSDLEKSYRVKIKTVHDFKKYSSRI